MPSYIQAQLLTASSGNFPDCAQALSCLGDWTLGPALWSLLSDPCPHRGHFSTHHIFGIWLHGDGPIELFPPPDGEAIFQVEDGLLPVGVGGIRG